MLRRLYEHDRMAGDRECRSEDGQKFGAEILATDVGQLFDHDHRSRWQWQWVRGRGRGRGVHARLRQSERVARRGGKKGTENGCSQGKTDRIAACERRLKAEICERSFVDGAVALTQFAFERHDRGRLSVTEAAATAAAATVALVVPGNDLIAERISQHAELKTQKGKKTRGRILCGSAQLRRRKEKWMLIR